MRRINEYASLTLGMTKEKIKLVNDFYGTSKVKAGDVGMKSAYYRCGICGYYCMREDFARTMLMHF